MGSLMRFVLAPARGLREGLSPSPIFPAGPARGRICPIAGQFLREIYAWIPARAGIKVRIRNEKQGFRQP
jgi:hypothetical protein